MVMAVVLVVAPVELIVGVSIILIMKSPILRVLVEFAVEARLLLEFEALIELERKVRFDCVSSSLVRRPTGVLSNNRLRALLKSVSRGRRSRIWRIRSCLFRARLQ
jgi:hypothetical protein